MSGLFGLLASAASGLASSVFGGSLGKLIANGVGSIGRLISGATNAGRATVGYASGRFSDAQKLWGTGKSLYSSTRNMMGAAKEGTLTTDAFKTYIGEVEDAASAGQQMYQRARNDTAHLNELYRGVRNDYRGVCNVGSGELTRPDHYSSSRSVYNPTYAGPQRLAPQTYNPYAR